MASDDSNITCAPPPSDHEYADEQLEYLGQGPEATGRGTGWNMSAELRLRCPQCCGFITADPTTYENCDCGQLHKDPGAGRVGLGYGRDSEIAVWRVIPREDLDGGDAVVALLDRLVRLLRQHGAAEPWAAWFDADRRALAAGDRAGLAHLLADGPGAFRDLRLYQGAGRDGIAEANQRLDDLRERVLMLASRIQ